MIIKFDLDIFLISQIIFLLIVLFICFVYNIIKFIKNNETNDLIKFKSNDVTRNIIKKLNKADKIFNKKRNKIIITKKDQKKLNKILKL